MSDKPLHVRVAEALGWTNCQLCPDGPDIHGRQHWVGDQPVIGGVVRQSHCMPEYDTDWAATGPLIEKYRISLSATYKLFDGDDGLPLPGDTWIASDDRRRAKGGFPVAMEPGSTPLIAVCNLILALHAAGKLSA